MALNTSKEVREIIENFIKAYEYLSKLIGKEIPKEEARKILKEVTHISIHELAHAAIHTAYPKIEELWRRDEVLGECVDELMGRILELVVSKELGIPTHTIEEHLHELKHYTNLSKLPISKEELTKLYREVIKRLESEGFEVAIKTVEAKCGEWLST